MQNKVKNLQMVPRDLAADIEKFFRKKPFRLRNLGFFNDPVIVHEIKNICMERTDFYSAFLSKKDPIISYLLLFAPLQLLDGLAPILRTNFDQICQIMFEEYFDDDGDLQYLKAIENQLKKTPIPKMDLNIDRIQTINPLILALIKVFIRKFDSRSELISIFNDGSKHVLLFIFYLMGDPSGAQKVYQHIIDNKILLPSKVKTQIEGIFLQSTLRIEGSEKYGKKLQWFMQNKQASVELKFLYAKYLRANCQYSLMKEYLKDYRLVTERAQQHNFIIRGGQCLKHDDRQIDKLYVLPVEGMGDQIRWVSFLHHLEEFLSARETVIICHPKLKDLFEIIYPQCDIIAMRAEDEVLRLSDRDRYLYSSEIPFFLEAGRARPKNFCVSSELAINAKTSLSNKTLKKVGVYWRTTAPVHGRASCVSDEWERPTFDEILQLIKRNPLFLFVILQPMMTRKELSALQRYDNCLVFPYNDLMFDDLLATAKVLVSLDGVINHWSVVSMIANCLGVSVLSYYDDEGYADALSKEWNKVEFIKLRGNSDRELLDGFDNFQHRI